MNLLINDLPTAIIDINGTLYFDTDELSEEDGFFDGECITYAINTDHRSIIDIMLMYEDDISNGNEKAYIMLIMLYINKIPPDTQQAFVKAMEFLNCGKDGQEENKSKAAKNYGRLYSFEQDGNYIYSAINYSHNDILKRVPDLHYWEFYNKFMQLKEDCQFNHIIANRLAHKKGKMTDEQKTERREYPEIYVLKEDRRIDDKRMAEMKEMERMLNS